MKTARIKPCRIPSASTPSMAITMLDALPYLIDYPYGCTEQTLNRFLSTGVLTSLYDDYPAVAELARQLSTRETRLEPWDGSDPG